MTNNLIDIDTGEEREKIGVGMETTHLHNRHA